MPRQPQIQNSLVYLQPKCRIKILWLAPTENCTDHTVSTDRHTAVQPHKDGNRREPVHIQRQHGWISQHQQQQQHAKRTGQTQKAIFCMSPFTWHRRKGDIGTRTGPWGKFSRWWKRSRPTSWWCLYNCIRLSKLIKLLMVCIWNLNKPDFTKQKTTYQKLWKVFKVILKGTFIALYADIRRERCLTIDKLNCPTKEGKTPRINPKKADKGKNINSWILKPMPNGKDQ